MKIYEVFERIWFCDHISFGFCGTYTSMAKAREQAMRLASRESGHNRFHFVNEWRIPEVNLDNSCYIKTAIQQVDQDEYSFGAWTIYIIQKEVK